MNGARLRLVAGIGIALAPFVGCTDRALSVSGAVDLPGGQPGVDGGIGDGGARDAAASGPDGSSGKADSGAGNGDGGGPFVPVGVDPCALGATPARMPHKTYDIGATSGLDGRIYLFNMGQDGSKTEAWAYTLGSSKWGRLADVPGHLISSSSPVRVGAELYAISNLVFAYTPMSDAWAAKSAIVPERVGMAATAGNDGKVYSNGGVLLGAQGGSRNAYVYDPASDKWSSLPDRSQLDGFAGTATGTDGAIYVIGEHAESFLPGTQTWTPLADPPTPRVNPGVVAIGSRIYTFGGREPSALPPSGVVEAFDPTTGTWSSRAPMPTPTNRASAALGCDGRVYVFGGVGPGGKLLDLVQAYDPIADTWVSSP